MQGIYTTTMSVATLDESPDVYKPAHEILDVTGDTADAIDMLTPVYNYKSVKGSSTDDMGKRERTTRYGPAHGLPEQRTTPR